MIEAAIDAGVERAVLLSTDKACSPATLYGSTKLVAERLFVAANSLGSTRFACTRYGNVTGSRGSVLEVWAKAIAEGRRLPITNGGMTRFHMTQAQAVALVMLALRHMDGGEIFVPKLPSYSVGALAEAVAPRVGWEVVGLRAGEKMHESLIGADESRTVSDYGDHFRIMPAVHPWRGARRIEWPVAAGFEFRSDSAPLSIAEVAALLEREKVTA